MNYQITFVDETSYIVTGVTFTQAVNYSQTIGKELSYISEINFEIIQIGELSNSGFNVQLKNLSTNKILSYMIFAQTIQDVMIWIDAQQNIEVIQFGKSLKTLVIS